MLGTRNAEMRKDLSGEQPKLFTPWLTFEDEPAAGQPPGYILPPFEMIGSNGSTVAPESHVNSHW